jgi:predicted thioredoxin/glutaredoxin
MDEPARNPDDIVDIKDIESFIEGLKKSFDVLDKLESEEKQGIQAQLAKAISKLREKKLDKTEAVPSALGDVSKQELKKILLNQLAHLNNTLKSFDSSVSSSKEKFRVIQEIERIREKIDKI